jgi:hypothetical protein
MESQKVFIGPNLEVQGRISSLESDPQIQFVYLSYKGCCHSSLYKRNKESSTCRICGKPKEITGIDGFDVLTFEPHKHHLEE